MRIAIVAISDSAFNGDQEDLSGPLVQSWLEKVITSSTSIKRVVIREDVDWIRDTLVDLSDQERVDVSLTTSGTGPAPGDHTPDAMRMVMGRELPGFG
jgi:molybdopterin adenylyltransferase